MEMKVKTEVTFSQDEIKAEVLEKLIKIGDGPWKVDFVFDKVMIPTNMDVGEPVYKTVFKIVCSKEE